MLKQTIQSEHLSKVINLDYDSYFDIEQLAKKIAAINKIDDVDTIEIKITSNSGFIRFKQAGQIPGVPDGTGPWNNTEECQIDHKNKKEESKEEKSEEVGSEEKENH